ncbi:uncharacterized protein LOC118509301 [Anopheles stephensi]|uniref:uncharacterized protein LOC118509301 n=1 Tax=Anopheles stephensi TaxID=30069 RepID=UPI0016587E16|nr:uncharacterized protein LOC118509301 [Anopheles stephensi]
MLPSVISEPFKLKHSFPKQIGWKMKNIFLTVVTLSGLYMLPICSGHLPYFNNRPTPSRVVAKPNYWYTHGSHASYYHQKENFARWPHASSKPLGPFPWQKKILSPQYNTHRPSSSTMIHTVKHNRPPPAQHPIGEATPEDGSNLSILIHQLQQKLQQVEQQLAENGTPKPDDPQQGVIEAAGPKPHPQQMEEPDSDPFWVKLDVVNKPLDPERLVKTIKILLENLKESTTPPPADTSDENVYNLIDIRGNFLTR